MRCQNVTEGKAKAAHSKTWRTVEPLWQKLTDHCADSLSIGATGSFGLHGFDDWPHVFLARGAEFLDSRANQLLQFFGRDRLRQECFQSRDFTRLFFGQL